MEKKISNEVRTRFAPSPTGFLHIGGARTALFNYLFAKKNNGFFILRIEDTDIERSKPEFDKDILDCLKWLGIEYNEGPYRQSERKEIYKRYLEKLLEEERAYYCFCPEEELEAQKQYQMSIGEAPRYSGKCSNLSKEEVVAKISVGEKAVIRFKTPARIVKFNDLIRGEVEFDAGLIGDIVIAKNMETPLYNFGAVVDDFEMKITHILRGEEHLSNTPKQILIQEALGFFHPEYGHIPLILAPDRSKLSKREGAVSTLEYKKIGYLPEALVNFIAFLGWNPGTEKEVFSLSELAQEFSLDGVQKAGAIFNVQRLDFLNGLYIRQKSLEKLAELSIAYFISTGLIETIQPKLAESLSNGNGHPEKQIFRIKETKEEISFDFIKNIVAAYRERLKKLSEITELADFFFRTELSYDRGALKWKNMREKDVLLSIDKSIDILSKIEDLNWTKENLEKILILESEKFSSKLYEGINDRGVLLWPLRVALSGKKVSASPFEIAAILGKEKTLKRLKSAKTGN
ncbi:MAG: glutamate--tRNA ligase [Candidatus Nealsonbacteria bacterium RIFCSPLOWO2_12_FULL_39_31]|uniref:Glutamate--tRNA ligase n=2 Tax=Candidatus Nealsoniibacteriota TaxID=1817911 RepID=A0A1G2ELC8_9BACT|nr:MAG: glutamate--tRNA ligase [Candidatus Nealsonbacteria bacterium RIFCSPHIGHO2_01_FULL_38_55]OGZ22842.1 MAG: glutamate--tRNA ligase [Candidatus Nealsonbacteria bacterium RIFCSPHIGHO2_12_FULL_38_18]OGZ26577.1 MAG: glutamate--tRNA ligase [Candidatus Nealsonbacteria bacterium RIFCSPLOWO2_12_FULL_39_31]